MGKAAGRGLGQCQGLAGCMRADAAVLLQRCQVLGLIHAVGRGPASALALASRPAAHHGMRRLPRLLRTTLLLVKRAAGWWGAGVRCWACCQQASGGMTSCRLACAHGCCWG